MSRKGQPQTESMTGSYSTICQLPSFTELDRTTRLCPYMAYYKTLWAWRTSYLEKSGFADGHLAPQIHLTGPALVPGVQVLFLISEHTLQ